MATAANDLKPQTTSEQTDGTADRLLEQLEERAPSSRPALRYLITPLVLGVICLALYLWVRSQPTDIVIGRILNPSFIFLRVLEHLQLAAVSTVLVILIAVPLGVALTRPFARPFSPAVLAVANIGQGTPGVGVIVLAALLFGVGFRTAVGALVFYSLLPILRNTMVGLQQVDRSIIEAGRGMGMTKAAVLFRIELPLAVPVILAGVRTALVINVGTATVATFIDAGGLGDMIDLGIRQTRNVVLVTGSVLTAVLALFIDWVGSLIESFLRPKGL